MHARRPGVSRREWITVAVLAVAAVILTTVLVARPGASQEPSAGGAAPPTTSGDAAATGPLGDIARRIPGDPLALGAVDAPVVMVMFSDYRCPFCAQFSRETEDELVSRYVDQGILRIEWRDFAIFGEQSTVAAQAGRAAAAQGRFWEFNEAIFADAPDRGHIDLPDDRLVEYARQVGVADLERFQAEMDSPANVEAVGADLIEATALGVPSTPAFVLNGAPILGAQPLEAFTTAIDAAIAG